MILSVLIGELKLRTKLFADETFSGIKFIKGLNAMRAVIVTTFMDSDIGTLFPEE